MNNQGLATTTRIITSRRHRLNLPYSTLGGKLEDQEDQRRYSSASSKLCCTNILSNAHLRANAGSDYVHLYTKREYHVTPKSESATIVLGLAVVAVGAKAGQYGLRAYEEWSKNRPAEEPEVKQQAKQEEKKDTSAKKGSVKKENFFSKFFGAGVGSKYYEGGFEDKMTRREAALILGVRESASAKRIKEAHRKILILNHPDTGGSTYMASKINEAKEMLLKGKE